MHIGIGFGLWIAQLSGSGGVVPSGTSLTEDDGTTLLTEDDGTTGLTTD